MTLNEIADELIELRRYVRSNIEHVRRKLITLDPGVLHDMRWNTDCPEWLRERAWSCIITGVEFIQVDPTYLENALYNAAADMRRIARKREPKEEPL